MKKFTAFLCILVSLFIITPATLAGSGGNSIKCTDFADEQSLIFKILSRFTNKIQSYPLVNDQTEQLAKELDDTRGLHTKSFNEVISIFAKTVESNQPAVCRAFASYVFNVLDKCNVKCALLVLAQKTFCHCAVMYSITDEQGKEEWVVCDLTEAITQYQKGNKFYWHNFFTPLLSYIQMWEWAGVVYAGSDFQKNEAVYNFYNATGSHFDFDTRSPDQWYYSRLPCCDMRMWFIKYSPTYAKLFIDFLEKNNHTLHKTGVRAQFENLSVARTCNLIINKFKDGLPLSDLKF